MARLRSESRWQHLLNLPGSGTSSATEINPRRGCQRSNQAGQTTIEYMTILCVMVGLLITIALFVSPRLRDMVKNLVARIECALSTSGGSNCGSPGGSSASGAGGSLSFGGSTSPGSSSSSPTLGGSQTGGAGSSSGGSHSNGGSSTGTTSSGGSSSAGGTGSSGGGGSSGTHTPPPPPPPAIGGNYTGPAFAGNSHATGSSNILQSSLTQTGNTISGYLIIADQHGTIREDVTGTVNGSNVSFHGTQLTNINMSMSGFSSYAPDYFVGTIQPNGTIVGQNYDSWGNNGTFTLTRH